MIPYEINSSIPIYMNDDVFNNIRNIEIRNWNRKLSQRNISFIYELVDAWHRRIDSTIQMLGSNTPIMDGVPDSRGFYRSNIFDNVGEIVYQYIMDEVGNLALFIENIVFNLPWNLGSGRIAINELHLCKNKILIKESQLRSIIRESLKKILNI